MVDTSSATGTAGYAGSFGLLVVPGRAIFGTTVGALGTLLIVVLVLRSISITSHGITRPTQHHCAER